MSPAAIAATTGKGTNALHIAAGGGHAGLVRVFLESGLIDKDAIVPSDGSTALDRAMCVKSSEAADVLRGILASLVAGCFLLGAWGLAVARNGMSLHSMVWHGLAWHGARLAFGSI